MWLQLTSHIRQWDQIRYKSITGSVTHEKHTKHLKTTTTQHQLWVNYGNATACSLSSIQQKIMSNYLGHRHHQIRTLCGLRSSTVRLDTLSIAMSLFSTRLKNEHPSWCLSAAVVPTIFTEKRAAGRTVVKEFSGSVVMLRRARGCAR